MEAINNQEDFSFKPSTNPKNSKIIMERAIARARGELPDRNRKPAEQVEEPQEKKGNKHFNANIFGSHLQRKELERLERLAALKRELHSEETSQCTFRPSISRNSISIATQKGYGNVIFTPPPPLPRELLQGGHLLRVGNRKEQGNNTNTNTTTTTTKNSNNTPTLPAGGFSNSSNNTSQRRVYPRRQAHEQEQESDVRHLLRSQIISSGGRNNNDNNTEMLMNVKEFGPETRVEDDKYIVALSSEVQDVLSEWTETVEEEKSLS
ncbi:hypothetical protein LSM04_002686 [Trypanosoma melophagium]|uniref:uncharacterized protein n=1 Tax=Trypanosoma melophagium TaxID=715481 RepID=UPI00351A1EEC|nr:hypothetical protein LSM04_002686 [Trypanosoma melophagium]